MEKSFECDDAISREAVKEIICAEFVDTQDGMSEWRNAVNDVVEEILHKVEQLPSVTQKSGKWIEHPEIETSVPEDLMFYECSECGNKQCYFKADTCRRRFCGVCGAKMESEDKE